MNRNGNGSVKSIKGYDCPKCTNNTLELHPNAVICTCGNFKFNREVVINGSAYVLDSVQCKKILLGSWNVSIVGDYYGHLTSDDHPEIIIFKGLKCPACGGNLLDCKLFIKCEHQIYNSKKYKNKISGCKFKIWRNGLSAHGHLLLTDNELRKLIQGNNIKVTLASTKGRWGKHLVNLCVNQNGYSSFQILIDDDEIWSPIPEPKPFI